MDSSPTAEINANENKRLLSLDFFRGITTAAMILVNNPGNWSHVYPPLLHDMNAITVFVLSGVVARLLYLIKWQTAGEVITLKEWLVNSFFLTWLSPVNASLAFALFFVFLSYLTMFYLYKKHIFIKI